jgi:membrane protease YdiL (CAAX protease family)
MTGEPDSPLIPSDGGTPPTSSGGPVHTIFKGPNGLRAGWRLLIFYALVAAIFVITLRVLALLHAGGAQASVSQLTPLSLGITESSILVVSVIAALIMTKIERRKFSQFGLPLRGALGKDFWKGSVWGFLSISAALLGIFAFHGFHVTGLAIHGWTIIGATAAWSVTFLIVGLAEEFAFRGYPQFTLSMGIGFWPSAFALSALFALAHVGNGGETIAGLLSVVLFGLLFCLFLQRTGNLWFAVGFHAGWDWGQTFFYGVRDSGILPYHNLFDSTFSGARWLTGGSVGPEASVFTPIVLLMAAILFAGLYRDTRYRAS